MSAGMCRMIHPVGRLTCLLLIAATLPGCSAFDALAKKNKASKDDEALAAEHRKNSFKELDHPVKLHLTYAQWKEEAGELKTARESYKTVLSAEPNNVEARLGMARIAYRTGQTTQAEQMFHEILSTSGGKPNVLDELAQFYAEEDRWGEAMQLLERAVQLDPEEPNYHYHLGIAMARTGDMRNAYNQFQTVMTDAESFYNLGFILYEQGDVPNAERHLVRSLQLKPDLVEARNLLSEMHSDALKPVHNDKDFRVVSGTTAPSQSNPQIQINPGQSRPRTQTAPPNSDQFQLPVQPGTGSQSPYPARGYQDPTSFRR